MTYVEQTIAKAIKGFREHEAIYTTGLSCIDVLDFRRNDKELFALRFVFDHQRIGRVYISGDLGTAVICPTCGATLYDMTECFTTRRSDGAIDVNADYFLEKAVLTSDNYEWDYNQFWDDFEQQCEKRYKDARTKAKVFDFIADYRDGDSNEDVCIFKAGVTFSDEADDKLMEIDRDCFEWIYDCGRRVAPRVILWLVALRLAYEAVRT